jgi:hypothetical protein
MAIKTITVLEPTSKAKIKEIEMVPRPSKLEGGVIGFLWNDKPNANFLLERFAELLADKLKLAEVVHCHKLSTAEAAPEEIINKLSRKCKGVVIASGDCGSCTSYVMHDAVELEKRGTPTVSVCTDEFLALGRTEAEALSFPSLAILDIPHPLGGVSMEETQAKADQAIDTLLELLTMPIEELKERAKRQFDF